MRTEAANVVELIVKKGLCEMKLNKWRFGEKI